MQCVCARARVCAVCVRGRGCPGAGGVWGLCECREHRRVGRCNAGVQEEERSRTTANPRCHPSASLLNLYELRVKINKINETFHA